MAQINLENLPEVINNKMDRDGLNASATFDCVIETYGPDNSGNWYRLYKSGWIEQGGTRVAATTWETLTFLKPFIDDKYTAQISNSAGGTNGNGIRNKTTTTMQIYQNWQYDWEAKGWGA